MKVPVTRITISLGVAVVLVGAVAAATPAASGLGQVDQGEIRQLTLDLCRKEAVAQEAMRRFRQKRTDKRLVRSGVAKSQMHQARELLEDEAGTTALGPIKKQYCPAVSRAYMASSNNELKQIAGNLCHEVIALRNAKKYKLVLIDNLADQLKPIYRQHASWYDEDSLRATSLKRLPRKAPTVKQVLKTC